MKFNIISSGSKGNATLIKSKKSLILIDMGISLTRLEEGCKEFNVKFIDIDGAIFTHNHSDHIGGIRFLSPKIMYALDGTLPGNLSNIVELNKSFIIKDFKITPFKTSHDAINPCGFLIEADNEKLVYMTDTGVFISENLPLIKNPDYLIIECNHDVQMLMNTNRTHELKMRILSDVGHLCNEDSAFASIDIIGDKTKEIILAHISEEANTPELALQAYKNIFEMKNVKLPNIRVANQWVSTLGGN